MPENPSRLAQLRARQRAVGMRAMETVMHETEIAELDRLKARLGVSSRSDVLRVLLAKTDPNSLTPADADALQQSHG